MATATPSPTYTLTEEHLEALLDKAVERALAARDQHYRDLVRETLEDEALGHAMQAVEGDDLVPLDDVLTELRAAS